MKTIKVLDHGAVSLVDFMGSDRRILETARISTGAEPVKGDVKDRGLIRYLYRNKHMTPLEACTFTFRVKAPIFVARQWMRSRTMCISGDTPLHFDLPCSVDSNHKRVYKIKLEDLYNKWEYGNTSVVPVRRRTFDSSKINMDQYYTIGEFCKITGMLPDTIRGTLRPHGILSKKNERGVYIIKGSVLDEFYNSKATRKFIVPMQEKISSMFLRSLDESTTDVIHTNITDIWRSGVKEVFRVEFSNGSILEATADHQCFTDLGWLRLEDAIKMGAKFASIGNNYTDYKEEPDFSEHDIANEIWKPVCIDGYEKYQVSSLGRVRNTKNTRNVLLKEPKIKNQCTSNVGYKCVSLSINGESRAFTVHTLVAKTFLDNEKKHPYVCHKDSNSLNNRVENLYWGTPKDNAVDRVVAGNHQKIAGVFVDVVNFTSIGKKETYDVSVSGPYHNFIAGGVVVHNSFNELSARYTTPPEEYYTPTHFREQGTTNHQGSGGNFGSEDNEEFLRDYEDVLENADFVYNSMKNQGVANEMARMGIPVSKYTEFYMTVNLRNLLHFLTLRLHDHAQYEIRVYAQAMYDMLMIMDEFKWTMEVFSDMLPLEYLFQRANKKHTELFEVLTKFVEEHGL